MGMLRKRQRTATLQELEARIAELRQKSDMQRGGNTGHALAGAIRVLEILLVRARCQTVRPNVACNVPLTNSDISQPDRDSAGCLAERTDSPWRSSGLTGRCRGIRIRVAKSRRAPMFRARALVILLVAFSLI